MRNELPRGLKLFDLKLIAEAGRDHGTQYDKGMQSVITEIASQKHFVPSRIGRLLVLASLDRSAKQSMITLEERSEVWDFLDSRGWTLNQGLKYAQGIAYAETAFARFQVEVAN